MSMQGRSTGSGVVLGFLITVMACVTVPEIRPGLNGAEAAPSSPGAGVEPHRSPIALALRPDGRRLLLANQTAGSVSLVDTETGRVLHELATGERPAGVAISTDGSHGVVTHWYGYDLALLKIENDHVAVAGRLEVRPEPRGVVLSRDGKDSLRGGGGDQRGGGSGPRAAWCDHTGGRGP